MHDEISQCLRCIDDPNSLNVNEEGTTTHGSTALQASMVFNYFQISSVSSSLNHEAPLQVVVFLRQQFGAMIKH
jgi:hypothetical protein